MLFICCVGALAIVAMGASLACSSFSALQWVRPRSRRNRHCVGLTATVEPLTTTPQLWLVYKLTFELHESGGRVGATATTQRFAFTNGAATDGNFNCMSHPAAPSTSSVLLGLCRVDLGVPRHFHGHLYR